MGTAVARYGATPDDWAHFDLMLGLGADLLPVVSNPTIQISPDSRMAGLGKTPSRINSNGHAVGFAKWTTHNASDDDIQRWSANADLGICLQTRSVRALDVDVPDPVLAGEITEFIESCLGRNLPRRLRSNSGKCLLALKIGVEARLAKRKIVVEGGIVEFLATGQQFIAVGTHPSGARYEWAGGLPDGFPEIDLITFDALWSALVTRFAIQPVAEAGTVTPRMRGDHTGADDMVADYLRATGRVLDERNGALYVECPWEDEHSSGVSGDSSTAWFTAGSNGYDHGHFKCMHAHCEHRGDSEYLDAVGYKLDVSDDFEVLPQDEVPDRYKLLSIQEFLKRKKPEWLIKRLLPKANIGVIYGESGSGKTFFVWDMISSIARGVEWRGKRAKQANVVYVCAEGESSFRERVSAYLEHTGVDHLPVRILADQPNLLEVRDTKDIIKAIKHQFDDVGVIVLDTLAQVMPGGNENSGEDMGKALAHARAISRATGAIVILVHHSGKDSAKGARGWSGLRAAADVEIEIVRAGDDRCATVTKLKDGEDGEMFGFKLVSVKTGVDEDGDDTSSCVLEHCEASSKPVKLNDKEVFALEKAQTLLDFGGEVYFETLRANIRDATPKPAGTDNRMRDAKNAIEGLIDKKKLQISADSRITLA